MELFKCKRCGVHRPAEDFYFAFGKKSDTCKICGKERRKRRKEFIRDIKPAVNELWIRLSREIRL